MFVHQPIPADPGYWGVLTNWDGQWYEYIATEGYPAAGAAAAATGQNPNPYMAWAFPPLFPLTVRGVMLLSGVSMPVAATMANLAFGAAAMIILYRLLERTGGRTLAASGVLLSSCFMAAPILQMVYSESLALLLLVAILSTIEGRHYFAASVLTLVLAFTRLVTAPIAVVCAVQVLHMLLRRRSSPSRKDLFGLCAVSVVAILGTWAWGWFTLIINATSPARRPSPTSVLNFGWFGGSVRIGQWPIAVALGILVVILVVISLGRWTADWPLPLRTWLWVYPSFLFVVTGMHGGILRYLLLCPGLALLPAASRGIFPPRTRTFVVMAACLLGLALQVYYIDKFLVVSPGTFMP